VRHTVDALFRTSEALRRRVEELEGVLAELHGALKMANDQNLYLAKRVRRLENALGSEGRDEVHEEGEV
jgi:hypothetical protein